MLNIFHQSKITDVKSTTWGKSFAPNEFQYLKNVINELINTEGGISEVMMQVDGQSKTLHIYEPFTALNYLGYGSPSVVSIKFTPNNKIVFLSGDDNGIEIHSNRLSASAEENFPKNLTPEICFWHFVDSIGDSSMYGETSQIVFLNT